MKKFLIAILLFVTIVTTKSEAKTVALKTDQLLSYTKDSELRYLPVSPYNINGNTYYRLRDIAVLTSQADRISGFTPEYDSVTNSVVIIPHRKVDYDFESYYMADRAAAVKSKQKVCLLQSEVKDAEDGNYSDWVRKFFFPIQLETYNIDGYNYFKLRDLASVLGFKIEYNEVEKTINIVSVYDRDVDPQVLSKRIDTMTRYASFLAGKLTYYDCDCSQFVGLVLDFADINLSTPPWTWTIEGAPELMAVPMSELRKGDILNRSDRPNQHIMIYLGNNKVAESVPDGGVKIGRLRTQGYKALRIIS